MLKSAGRPVETIAGGVLNGTLAASPNTVDGGTVVPLDLAALSGQAPTITSQTEIESGSPERTDPAALVVGPTGLGLDGGNGTLFGLAVASEGAGVYFVDDATNSLDLLH